MLEYELKYPIRAVIYRASRVFNFDLRQFFSSDEFENIVNESFVIVKLDLKT